MLKFPILCAVLAVSAALAPQVVMKADHESLVAMRIQGTWRTDVATSERLDPKRTSSGPKELTLTDNPGVLAGLQAHSERFKNSQIIGSGIVNVDGTAHTYILVAEHAGTSLVWFTGNDAGTDPVAQVSAKSVTVALAKEASSDMLFLGGDLRGGAATAYAHPAQKTR